MRQTREERNARSRQLRWDEHWKIIDGYRNAYAAMYQRAMKEHWTHESILAYIRKWIDRPDGSCIAGGIGRVPTTDYESGYIQGVRDLLYQQHTSQLVFCYRHPDKLSVFRPAHELCNAGLASRLVSGETACPIGGYYHTTHSGNFFYRNERSQFASYTDAEFLDVEYTDAFDGSYAMGLEASQRQWNEIPATEMYSYTRG